MSSKGGFLHVLSITTLGMAACAGLDEPADLPVVSELERSGDAVRIERGADGATRVLAIAAPVASGLTDPVAAAQRFVAEHADALGLDPGDLASFVVAQVDVDPASRLRHVTLQRTYAGIEVFQGAVTVHLDARNAVFEILGDEHYRIAPPVNRRVLAPVDAAAAAGKALGLALAPIIATSDARAFASPRTDELVVEPRIFQVAPGDDHFAYQVIASWRDAGREPHSVLALIDAEDGALLFEHSLVDTAFTARVFTASPGAAPVGDTRVVVSMTGDPVASPSGWVEPVPRRTFGNNANVATDLNGDNVIGAGEVQPIANASDAFDFPFSPVLSGALFRPAAVTNAFYLVNNFHDRTYALGFTEAARNFQRNNFGLGGAQNDEMLVDVQDGSGSNNAFFATPPDGLKPRMTLFLFSLFGAPRDSAFDPTVVYHEATHGLSNRLVGGGSTACLGPLQSGAMGEGWGDFVAASFLNNPVIGAYVTGNAVTGIRNASMASSPFRYDDLQLGTINQIHDAGEIWAAALWDARTAVGASTIERLVVTGMKLTPCNPTMVQARDGILQADLLTTGGVNQCALRAAFAGRGLGTGAASPNASSTTAIVTSTSVPASCGGVGTVRTLRSASTPLAIPDNNPVGVNAVINVATPGLTVQHVTVDVNLTHTFRGDLIIQVIAPNGQISTLSNLAGGAADDFITTGQDISASFTVGSPATGVWRLFVRDLAGADIGTINLFRLSITS